MGPVGNQGVPGPAGATGYTGLRGPQGIAGPRGLQGQKGKYGPIMNTLITLTPGIYLRGRVGSAVGHGLLALGHKPRSGYI